MDDAVRRDDESPVGGGLAAERVGHPPARFSHEEVARRSIPWCDSEFPVSVVPARSDPREVERSGPETANAVDVTKHLPKDDGQFIGMLVVVASQHAETVMTHFAEFDIRAWNIGVIEAVAQGEAPYVEVSR